MLINSIINNINVVVVVFLLRVVGTRLHFDVIRVSLLAAEHRLLELLVVVKRLVLILLYYVSETSSDHVCFELAAPVAERAGPAEQQLLKGLPLQIEELDLVI